MAATKLNAMRILTYILCVENLVSCRDKYVPRTNRLAFMCYNGSLTMLLAFIDLSY
jgi:hypothetical protein